MLPPDMTKDAALGRHVLLELYECPPDLLSDGEALEWMLCNAASLMGATVVSSHFHRFSPYGITGVVVIQESHLTIHTWPEHCYAAVDIFTCGQIDLAVGTAYIAEATQAGRSEWAVHKRGVGIGRAG